MCRIQRAQKRQTHWWFLKPTSEIKGGKRRNLWLVPQFVWPFLSLGFFFPFFELCAFFSSLFLSHLHLSLKRAKYLCIPWVGPKIQWALSNARKSQQKMEGSWRPHSPKQSIKNIWSSGPLALFLCPGRSNFWETQNWTRKIFLLGLKGHLDASVHPRRLLSTGHFVQYCSSSTLDYAHFQTRCCIVCKPPFSKVILSH